MLAVARWMFKHGAENVCMHPDGMHAKQFDICRWLESQRFEKISGRGKTSVAGTYTRDRHTLDIDFVPGRGDVVAEVRGRRVVVEAKGGIINNVPRGSKVEAAPTPPRSSRHAA